MPRITGEAAARGTAFHEWVAASSEQLALIPDWDQALDADRVADDELGELIAGYRTTPYAHMTPVAVETEIAVRVGAMVVRGVIDAVFQHPDGSWEVVDWKTNRAQTADPLQLSIYRLGWAQQTGAALDQVRQRSSTSATGRWCVRRCSRPMNWRTCWLRGRTKP